MIVSTSAVIGNVTPPTEITPPALMVTGSGIPADTRFPSLNDAEVCLEVPSAKAPEVSRFNSHGVIVTVLPAASGCEAG